MIILTVALALLGVADTPRPLGKETAIPFAANGGLRDWQSGPPGSSTVYVRDRNENWYLVALTGPCADNAASSTLNYTTDDAGTFDRFSHVTVLDRPSGRCGVTSIRTSAPPPGQPGAPKQQH